MEKFNCLAEAEADKHYYRQGHMGTESISLSFDIKDEDIETIETLETLTIFGKGQGFEVNMQEMKIEFSYSEEGE